MTKNMKIAAIVSAAALLAIGASMTSFAATGWQEEDGTWKYYDKYGEAVTDTWEKSGSNWFYLDDNGDMATDSLIEDDDNYYYVDANGAMVTNNWVQMDNSDDDDEDAPATVWYYFQNNGKAYKAPTTSKTSFKTINGKKYAFDEDAKMLFGWVDAESTRQTGDDAWKEGTYYCGDENDGAENYNSWAHLAVVDDREDDEDQDYWFYFGSNGKKYYYNKTEGFYEKTINGKKYSFDVYGKMLSEFVATGDDQYGIGDNTASVSDSGSATLNGVKYFSSAEDGARATKGWFRVVPNAMFDQADSEDYDDNARWFYADGKGFFYEDAIKTINGKKYAFDSNGEMVWGLRYISFDSKGDIDTIEDEIDDSDKLDAATDVEKNTHSWVSDKDGVYFFGDEVTDGAEKTGTQTVTVDGDSYSFNFKTTGSAKGQGIQGKKDNAFYVNGRKVKADSDDKYDIYTYNDTSKVMSKESVKDLFGKQEQSGTWADTTDYKGDKGGTQNKFFADAYASDGEYAYIVIGSSGQWVKSGTKKDGNDYKIVVKKSQVCGIYYEK